MYFNIADERWAIKKIIYEEQKIMAFDFPEYEYEEMVHQHYRKLRHVCNQKVKLQVHSAWIGTYIGCYKRLRRKSILLKEKILNNPTWETIEEIKLLMDKYEKTRREVKEHGF